MAVTNAVILIPDISGFTRFFSEMEIEHAAEIIDTLLASMIHEMNPYFTINEIEGDALLAFREESVPEKKRILAYCNQIFTAFGSEKKRLENDITCQCGACSSIEDLSLKFIGHYGKLAMTSVMGFQKAFGIDMIIAHRLLKNRLPSNQYILLTTALTDVCADNYVVEGDWQAGDDDYEGIGKVHYHYTLLTTEALRKADDKMLG